MYVWFTYNIDWHRLLQANKYLVIMKYEPGTMLSISPHRTFLYYSLF